MNRHSYQHAGRRPRLSWWRRPALPATLLVLAIGALIWELSWAIPLLYP
ncbi:hypothetical protein ACWKWN_18345 [Microbacterium trichothecenolyticum]